MDYHEMTIPQRAEYLLSKGIETKLDIDPVTLQPGLAAHVTGVGMLPVGYHRTAQAAIDAGTAWLRKKMET